MSPDLHFDCVGGVSGDMLLGALCELYGKPDLLVSVPGRLRLPQVTVEIKRAERHHLASTQVRVSRPQGERARHLSDVRALLEQADLPVPVRQLAVRVFERLAEAEAGVHGTSVERVHFHEVGAADALVDIAGVCLLVHELGPRRVTGSALPVSGGTVRAAHGVLPLPAPAVLELLKGWPVEWLEEEGERVTPTGAALLTTLAESGRPVPGSLRKVGCGAGSAEFATRANVLRALLIEPAHAASPMQPVTELTCVIDNTTGEDLAWALEILLGEGALDVYYVPAVMKKGRPGWELGVLCDADSADRLAAAVLRHTGTSGVRRRDIVRYALGRSEQTLPTRFGNIRVKLYELADGSVRPAPEYEDLKQAALRHGLTVTEVRAETIQAFRTNGRMG